MIEIQLHFLNERVSVIWRVGIFHTLLRLNQCGMCTLVVPRSLYSINAYLFAHSLFMALESESRFRVPVFDSNVWKRESFDST